MRLDPIRAVVADRALRRGLAEANVEAAYVTGYRRPMPAGASSELLAAFMPSANADDAALRHPGRGRDAAARAALEELFQLVDVDVARTVARRSAAIGYTGPIGMPCVATVGMPGRAKSEVVAVHHPLLTGKGAFAAVEKVGNRYWLDDTGEPAWTAMPWHWIANLHPERPVPPLDVSALSMRIEALLAIPAGDVSDEMLAAVMEFLAAGAGPDAGRGLGR